VYISFAVFADAANLSQEGKLNVLGIFDAVQVSGFPTVHPRTHFVLRLKGGMQDVGDHTLTFRWTNPRGDELWQSTGNLQLNAGTRPSAIEVDLPVVAVVDLPLDVAGQYAMHVELNNQPVTQVPLFVNGPLAAGPTLGLVS
jgi:hypothetical protein